MMELGKRIAELRASHGWTWAHVAKLMGTNSRSVENWETGVSIPSIENVLRLCQVFHTTPNALLGVAPKSILVLDNLPPADQYTMRGLYKILEDKNRKHR